MEALVLSVRYKKEVGRTLQCVKAVGFFLSLVLSSWLLSIAVGTNSCSWLGWFALVPLFMAIRILRPPSAAIAAAIWGACYYLFSITADSSMIVSGLLPIVLLVTIPAIYAFFGSLTTRRIGFNPLILALGWIAVEFTLQPLGLKHGLLAGTQGNGVLLDTVGRALGYVLVAFMVVSVNASLLALMSIKQINIPIYNSIVESANSELCVFSHVSFYPQTLSCRQRQPRAPPKNNCLLN